MYGSSAICWLKPLLCLLVSVSSLPAYATDPVPLPAQPSDVPWPTTNWSTAGVSLDLEKALDDVLSPVFTSEIGEGLGETRAIIVIRNGAIVHERYRKGITSDHRHVSWSIAKSITTTLVGRAVQTGLIASIDDPMPGAFEDGDPRLAISWRQWLQLLDGLDYAEYGVTDLLENDAVAMMYGNGRFDQLAYARDAFMQAYAPGTHWNYSTASFHFVARALQSLLPNTCVIQGENPRTCRADPRVMSDWMETVFYGPLGIDGIEEYDAAGTLLGGSSVYMSARDYARFGLLILRDGMWDGERLLPEGWIDMNRTNPAASDTNVYGTGFWPSPESNDNPLIRFPAPYDAFHAGGREGQLVWIVPSRDLVIVRVGLMTDEPENWNALFQLAQDIGRALD